MAIAVPKMAAASAYVRFVRLDIGANMEVERSTRSKVRPGSSGMLFKDSLSPCSKAHSQRTELFLTLLYADRNRIGRTLHRLISSGEVILFMTIFATSSDTPALSKFLRLRRSAITPMEGITASHASLSMGPSSHPAKNSQVIPASWRI